ncbi:hypothetical protein [Micromonospora sp. CPCC 206061]|uniref:hypothetical protein n=1 Tax=Micromonospora sp. CPCC 206061 TaxID=3122410 RepID=UPI002FEF912D
MTTKRDVTAFERRFHAKLKALYDGHRREDGKVYTNAEIADKIKKSGSGVTVTEAYLSLLRNEKAPLPRIDVAAAIARAFGAPGNYFQDIEDDDVTPRLDADDVEGQLRALVIENPGAASQVELLLELHRAGIRDFAARGTQYSDAGRQAMIRLVRAATQLSDQERGAVVRVAEVMADSTSDKSPGDDAG